MRTKIIAPLTTLALSGAFLVGIAAPSNAVAPAAAPGAVAAANPQVGAATVTGTINETIEGVGTLVGSFTPTGFTNDRGQLVVTGLLEGTFTDLNGVTTEVSQTVTSTVEGLTGGSAACDILNLDLGPLHLDVLGLVVDLDEVHLDITAEPGAGNLLGNLLCSVANALNPGGGGGGLANLLNRLLGLLG
ncbi:ABC transporter substrate-binding protein [Pseudarthrobacter sp. J64]|uniref:ABC transporter substrate-binding protein n=1 Tax=Pseudarthrobacter sp. J64 TaxID=3116485 RepID=UPI002E8249EF|nr:ABC transporter substrate-binding protein [Pseudarthrobacter sp. J64]MEE2570347.1 ABC transporter substrate-binding protein [Pseudarthrobacter sp. J64]